MAHSSGLLPAYLTAKNRAEIWREVVEFGSLEEQEKYEDRPGRWGDEVRNKQLPKYNNLAKFKPVKEFRMIHNACRLMQMSMQMMQTGMSCLPLCREQDGAGQGLR